MFDTDIITLIINGETNEAEPIQKSDYKNWWLLSGNPCMTFGNIQDAL